MRAIARRTAGLLRLPLIAAVAALLSYLAWMGLAGTVSAFERPTLPVLHDRDLGDRILVVAPHPDDEALAAGGLIRRSVAEGKRVKVVVATCGDGFRRIVGGYRDGTASPYLRLGSVRAEESRRAMRTLGLTSADVVFLGYPDGSLASLWQGPWDKPATGVNGCDSVPYAFAHTSGASYDASSVVADLSSIVASFAPTAVVYPDAEDSNADHWALNAFAELTLDRMGTSPGRFTYLVHRGHFPFPWSYVPGDWILPPRRLTGLGTVWLSSPVSRADEEIKETAIAEYRSQHRAMEPFLDAFVRRNELFGVWTTPAVVARRVSASLDASSMPGVVIRDPSADTLLRLVDDGGDLSRVAVVRQRDGVWVGLEARGAISRSFTYRFSLRLQGRGEEPGRVDVDVSRGRAQAQATGPVGWNGGAVEARVSGKRLWVKLPGASLAGASQGMIGVEARQGRTVIDRTAVRCFELR